MKEPVYFEIKVPIKLTKRKKWFLVSCQPLDIHSQGETEQKARKNLHEAISAFLDSCCERGTFLTVLKDCGLVPDKIQPFPTTSIKTSTKNYINVPITCTIDPRVHRACHV